MKKSFHVGATPRSMLFTSVSGEKTSTAPTTTSSTCVARSTSASTMLTPADSRTPNTLIAARTTITPMPNRMSPGAWRNGSQKSPPM